tara:strand:+ start:818 stop:997 length:180 start_codon:yes stop_codon:yes gene_type:complete
LLLILLIFITWPERTGHNQRSQEKIQLTSPAGYHGSCEHELVATGQNLVIKDTNKTSRN